MTADGELTHLQVGWWRGPQIDAVTVIGHINDLHGTVCTCCPRRQQATAPPEDGAPSA